MGPVGFTMGYLAQGQRVVKKTTDLVGLSTNSQLPSTFHIDIAPLDSLLGGVHAHRDCMLGRKSTFTASHFQRRVPPFTCIYI